MGISKVIVYSLLALGVIAIGALLLMLVTW